jgi:hypothetical protein
MEQSNAESALFLFVRHFDHTFDTWTYYLCAYAVLKKIKNKCFAFLQVRFVSRTPCRRNLYNMVAALRLVAELECED